VNAVPYDLREQMVACSFDFPPGVDETEEVGLAVTPSEIVGPPRIADSLVSMECRVERVIPFGGTSMIVGRVVLVHVADEVAEDGLVAFRKLRPLGRLGGLEYLDHERGVFEIPRPG
jgi:flavin reductase (DIM6/NTAB) family NADH-FMN oxidoreductase RutF